jgi:hypothetical protein
LSPEPSTLPEHVCLEPRACPRERHVQERLAHECAIEGTASYLLPRGRTMFKNLCAKYLTSKHTEKKNENCALVRALPGSPVPLYALCLALCLPIRRTRSAAGTRPARPLCTRPARPLRAILCALAGATREPRRREDTGWAGLEGTRSCRSGQAEFNQC